MNRADVGTAVRIVTDEQVDLFDFPGFAMVAVPTIG